MSTSGFGIRGRVIDYTDGWPGAASLRRGPERRGSRLARASWWIVALLLALALWQISSAGWVHAKAQVAQWMIERAWSQAVRTGSAPRPWPWADTQPVARLRVAARGVDLFVLEGASGRSLAFGPGHVSGTASPGSGGNSVIVAHRDTHFAFLRELREDEEIAVEDARGRVARYRVREAAIVSRGETRVLDPADSPQLTLITCYPFDAVRPGTTLRYVVIADRIAVTDLSRSRHAPRA
jgi:sortase A